MKIQIVNEGEVPGPGIFFLAKVSDKLVYSSLEVIIHPWGWSGSDGDPLGVTDKKHYYGTLGLKWCKDGVWYGIWWRTSKPVSRILEGLRWFTRSKGGKKTYSM